MDRIWALQDVIPAKTRKSISDKCSSVYGWGKYGAKFLGNSAWVLTTSALLLVLPLMIELEHEQGLIEYEKMQQQSNQASAVVVSRKVALCWQPIWTVGY
ncbi:mitochondrial import receptor protein [Dissophora globulifera]|nr:mitochondrial import receptor protein [Dissophora globulifera]